MNENTKLEGGVLRTPMWSGDENESPEEWARWRQNLLAVAGLRGLYNITREEYNEPDEESKEYRAYVESSQQLWFMLAGYTRGSAALVIMKHENKLGNQPNGRAALLRFSYQIK